MTLEQELIVQRLVDGELSPEERAAYLRQIDGNVAAWRDVALAFIEQQVWRSYAQEFAGPAEYRRPQTVDESRLPAIERADSKRIKASKRPTVSGQTSWRVWGPRLMLTAAATLFALTLALRFTTPPPYSNDQMLQAPPPTIQQRPEQPGPMVTATEQPLMLQVGDDLQVPLFQQFEQLTDALNTANFDINPAVQRQFMDAGYQLQPNLRFISGRVAEDGRAFLVPVHGWQVRPYVQ